MLEVKGRRKGERRVETKKINTIIIGQLKALIMPRFYDSLQNLLSVLAQDSFDEIASSELARVLLQVGCVFLALGKAHSDIKPNNVMITDGTFVVYFTYFPPCYLPCYPPHSHIFWC